MKLLLVDFNMDYVNPTRAATHDLLLRGLGATGFGPGFVDEDTLRGGVANFYRIHGPFDAVLVPEQVAFADFFSGAEHEMALDRNYARNFSRDLLSFRNVLLDDVLQLPTSRIAITLESDYWNFSEAQIARLEDHFDLIVGWGSQFVRHSKELPGLASESFAHSVNDLWADFAVSHQERIVPVGHFLDPGEFNSRPLESRPRVLAVPGVQYRQRQLATQSMPPLPRTMERARRLGTRIAGRSLTELRLNRLSISVRRRLFRQHIAASICAFTCGSGLEWPLRKFFEIPALGTVLLTSPNPALAPLGFREGEHYLSCDPSSAYDEAIRWRNSMGVLQGIATSGQRFVLENHSIAKRVQQLRTALDLFGRNRWKGAEWVDGDMVPL